MIIDPATQTVRLVCRTTSLPDAVKHGCIPPRDALSRARIPAGVEAFSLPHLGKQPHFTHLFLADDCTGTGTGTATGLPVELSLPADPSVQDSALALPADCLPDQSIDAASAFAMLPAECPVTRIGALRDRDYGTWHGQALRALPPDAMNALLNDADFAPPEGESLRQFQGRIGQWLNTLVHTADGVAKPLSGASSASRAAASQTATLLLVARPAVVRALAIHILKGTPETALRLDIAPQTTSLLTYHAGLWRVRMLGVP